MILPNWAMSCASCSAATFAWFAIVIWAGV